MSYPIQVSNLPSNFSHHDLENFFKQNGFKDISIKCKTDYHGQKPDGIEYVSLKPGNNDSNKNIETAINRLNGKSFKGKEIQLMHHLRYTEDGEGQIPKGNNNNTRNNNNIR